MSNFFQPVAAATAQNGMVFSESFWLNVLNEYGLLGVIVLGLIVGIVLFIKYATKKLENEEKKLERDDDIKAIVVTISGLLEQVKREADGNQSALDLKMSEIKKANDATLSEISKIGIIMERDTSESRREFTEIKAQLRDIYRDLFPRGR